MGTSFDKRQTRLPHLITQHSQSSQCPVPMIPTLATISSHSTPSKATAVAAAAAATLLNKATIKVATASNSNTLSRATHSILLRIKASALLIVKTPSALPSRAVSNTAKPVANTVPMMLAPETDRGLLGAIGGGFGGHFMGKKAGHGFLGAVGGAILGSLAEDFVKDKKKKPHHSSQSSWGGSRY